MQSLFNWLEARRKRRAILRYITELGPLLARTYGKSEFYTPARVRKIRQQSGFSEQHEVYALVLFCTPTRFAADQAARGKTAQYWPLRAEIIACDFRRGHDKSEGGSWGAELFPDQTTIAGSSGSEAHSHF